MSVFFNVLKYNLSTTNNKGPIVSFAEVDVLGVENARLLGFK